MSRFAELFYEIDKTTKDSITVDTTEGSVDLKAASSGFVRVGDQYYAYTGITSGATFVGVSPDPSKLEGQLTAYITRHLTKTDLERMNLPPEFWRTRVQQVPESRRAVIERYLIRINEMLDKNAGLLLSGPEGVGKTAIASLILKTARERGCSALFITLSDLRESVRSRGMWDDDQSILDRAKTVDVLALDALALTDLNDKFWGATAILDLLVNRGTHQRLTILTTRLTSDVLTTEASTLLSATQSYLVPLSVTGPNQRAATKKALTSTVLGNGK